MGCGHTSCKDCWRQYLTYKILDDGDVDSISCPDTKCGIAVDDVTVMQLICDNEKAKQKYQYLMTNSFVQVKNYFDQKLTSKYIFTIMNVILMQFLITAQFNTIALVSVPKLYVSN